MQTSLSLQSWFAFLRLPHETDFDRVVPSWGRFRTWWKEEEEVWWLSCDTSQVFVSLIRGTHIRLATVCGPVELFEWLLDIFPLDEILPGFPAHCSLTRLHRDTWLALHSLSPSSSLSTSSLLFQYEYIPLTYLAQVNLSHYSSWLFPKCRPPWINTPKRPFLVSSSRCLGHLFLARKSISHPISTN